MEECVVNLVKLFQEIDTLSLMCDMQVDDLPKEEEFLLHDRYVLIFQTVEMLCDSTTSILSLFLNCSISKECDLQKYQFHVKCWDIPCTIVNIRKLITYILRDCDILISEYISRENNVYFARLQRFLHKLDVEMEMIQCIEEISSLHVCTDNMFMCMNE